MKLKQRDSVKSIYKNSNKTAQEKGSFTDSRDKKTYKTVKIGELVWMAENLNYDAKGRSAMMTNLPTAQNMDDFTVGQSSGNGLDSYGFSALPGGSGFSGGLFGGVGDGGWWWSSNEDDSSNAYYLSMGFGHENAGYSSLDKSVLFSVRCVED
jgi:hypothetical protein